MIIFDLAPTRSQNAPVYNFTKCDFSQIGLYSSFMACFIYTVFGSCKDPALGPTAIMAIMTRENIHDMGPEFAILLCFITGIVQLIMGVAQLGKSSDRTPRRPTSLPIVTVRASYDFFFSFF